MAGNQHVSARTARHEARMALQQALEDQAEAAAAAALAAEQATETQTAINGTASLVAEEGTATQVTAGATVTQMSNNDQTVRAAGSAAASRASSDAAQPTRASQGHGEVATGLAAHGHSAQHRGAHESGRGHDATRYIQGQQLPSADFPRREMDNGDVFPGGPQGKFGRTWHTSDLYLEVSAKLQDEAAEWFHRISGTVRAEDETLENLIALLQTKYGNHLDATEVMNRIRERKQMPGESLSDFSSALLELGGDKVIDDSWYVSSFLNGMDNQAMAQFIKAQHPHDLLEATQMAIRDCGTYGEGTRVGWEEASSRHSRNTGVVRTLGGGARLVQPPAASMAGLLQPTVGAQLVSPLVAGQRMTVPQPPQLVASTNPPRYDAEGRSLVPQITNPPASFQPVFPTGFMWPPMATAPVSQSQLYGIPTPGVKQESFAMNSPQATLGPQLQPQFSASVPTQAASGQSPSAQYQGTQRSSAGASTAAIGHDQRQQQNRSFRNNERRATTYQAASSRISGPQHPLTTREERLANQRLYEERRRQRQARTTGDKSKRCYYCGFEGHLSFECQLKKEDQSAASQLPAPAPPARATPGQQPSGNEEGA